MTGNSEQLDRMSRMLGDSIAKEGKLRKLSAMATPLRLALLLLAALAPVLLSALLWGRADLIHHSPARFSIEVAVLVALGAAFIWFVVGAWHSQRVDGRTQTTLACISLLAVTWFVIAPQAHSLTRAFRLSTASFCLASGLLAAAPTLALALILGRGPQRRLADTLPALALATVVGILTLHLHCPIVTASHLAFHTAVAPVLVGIVVFAFFARKSVKRVFPAHPS